MKELGDLRMTIARDLHVLPHEVDAMPCADALDLSWHFRDWPPLFMLKAATTPGLKLPGVEEEWTPPPPGPMKGI